MKTMLMFWLVICYSPHKKAIPYLFRVALSHPPCVRLRIMRWWLVMAHLIHSRSCGTARGLDWMLYTFGRIMLSVHEEKREKSVRKGCFMLSSKYWVTAKKNEPSCAQNISTKSIEQLIESFCRADTCRHIGREVYTCDDLPWQLESIFVSCSLNTFFASLSKRAQIGPSVRPGTISEYYSAFGATNES